MYTLLPLLHFVQVELKSIGALNLDRDIAKDEESALFVVEVL